MPQPDRFVPRERPARRWRGNQLELQERRERSRVQEIGGFGYREFGDV